jgi:hypothetical protein
MEFLYPNNHHLGLAEALVENGTILHVSHTEKHMRPRLVSQKITKEECVMTIGSAEEEKRFPRQRSTCTVMVPT